VIVEATARPVVVTGTSPFDAWKRTEMAIGAFVAGYRNERTRLAYLQDLKAWLAFLEERSVDDPINGVERSHFEVWMRQMEAAGKAVATIARRVGTTMVWYDWLVDEDYIVKSPGRKVQRPSVPNVSSTPWLSARQLADFIDTAEKIGGYPAATVLILGINGLRVSELINCDIEDYETVRHHHVLNIVGKGNKPATVALPPRTAFVLRNVLDGRTTGPLILNEWERRTTRECVQRVLDRVRRQCGITTRITPHGLRHSAITAALDYGVPLRDVQHFARHASANTTTRYDRGGNSLDKSTSYTLSQRLAG